MTPSFIASAELSYFSLADLNNGQRKGSEIRLQFRFASGDWDASFIDGLAAASELVLLDNCGIGASSDNGAPFDIRQLAEDTARVIKALEFERASVLGWSLDGCIAQTLALEHPARINKLILLSTDPGGTDAKLASPDVRSRLADMSGTPHEQARRLLSVLFPADLAESIYQKFGGIVAAARAQLTSSAGRSRRWTLGTAMALATGFGS